MFLGQSWLTWAGICLFIGAMVCSGQFPLHVWLADAAEAPTPALAMLGSVASVAAGAFVVARLYGIFTLDARFFIAVIGCISFAAGALMALVQTNLKRILTFSTVSHMGLIMLFFGCGAYVAALFVLVVHAFCKACLFLAAGSVLHSCHGETHLRRMGGLWKSLPITAATFMLAMLSLCGTPWLSGFFGQGMGMAIVKQYAYALPGFYGRLLWWIPACTIYLIAIYMWRCWWLVFGGKPRDLELRDAAHENPLMTLVLILLAGLTIVAMYLKIDEIVSKSIPVMAMVSSAPLPDPLEAIENNSGWSSIITALIVMLFYAPSFNLADRLRRLPVINLFYLWLRENMFLDYLYEGVVVALLAIDCRNLQAVGPLYGGWRSGTDRPGGWNSGLRCRRNWTTVSSMHHCAGLSWPRDLLNVCCSVLLYPLRRPCDSPRYYFDQSNTVVADCTTGHRGDASAISAGRQDQDHPQHRPDFYAAYIFVCHRRGVHVQLE